MLHALPGLGADRRMFSSFWTNLPNFVAHDWMSFCGESSLEAVAKSICEAHQIRDNDSIIGCSLGGMVACEITKIRKIKTLVLVGSAIQPGEISKALKALHPLAKITPIKLFQFLAKRNPGELMQMFGAADASFVRAMCFAIFKWQGLTNSNTKIYRLHGKHDAVIPPPVNVDLLLNGGHLISMTHARECMEYLKSNLDYEKF